MPRYFNTAGPVHADQHYCIDPVARVDWDDIHHLIAAKKFFVLHAPRQTGKTSTLLAMADKLNQSNEYSALYINVEAAQTARNDVEQGMKAIVSRLVEGAKYRLQETRLQDWQHDCWQSSGANAVFNSLLSQWALASDKPIVLMIDEVDALVGDTLISLLRQLREGYIGRPAIPFPQSVILCGLRDVRDYRIHTSHHEIITGGSAFNIKAKSLRMGNFTEDEVKRLYAQHMTETGQLFEASISPELWEDTRGQPWLVNALGHELTWENKAARDRTVNITLEDYRAARERLIQSRVTHLDQLTDKLRETRVRPDLFIEWPVDERKGYYGEVQRVVLELKILYKSLETTVTEGLAQTVGYADQCGAEEAHLIIFDRRPEIAWEEKIWQRAEQVSGRSLGIWGM